MSVLTMMLQKIKITFCLSVQYSINSYQLLNGGSDAANLVYYGPSAVL